MSLETPPARTPMVRIEIQPSPPVPDRAVPLWWGYSRLMFHEPGDPGKRIWERDIVEARQYENATFRCEKRDGFGWVILIEITHDGARKALEKLGIEPRFLQPAGRD